jgi:hypothetical protein
MQLIQKNLPRNNWVKPVLYLTLLCLALSCKPFLYKQGFGLVFDYEVATGRIKRSTHWLASQIDAPNQKPTVVYKGDK